MFIYRVGPSSFCVMWFGPRTTKVSNKLLLLLYLNLPLCLWSCVYFSLKLYLDWSTWKLCISSHCWMSIWEKSVGHLCWSKNNSDSCRSYATVSLWIRVCGSCLWIQSVICWLFTAFKYTLTITFTSCMVLLYIILFSLLITKCLQCFDAVGWAAGRASSL